VQEAPHEVVLAGNGDAGRTILAGKAEFMRGQGIDVGSCARESKAELDQGATVVVIEHDLDVIRSADYIVDMGPGGGAEGGRIVVSGTPAQVRACPESLTGRFL
jgi:hypothetical protein